jgi:hypothetical protein
MSELPSNESTTPSEGQDEEENNRRVFLQSMGKWSGAAIVAAVAGVGIGTAPDARAASWINRRGGWINGRGGGGSWVNRGGGGGWVNRRGGGGWINRR